MICEVAVNKDSSTLSALKAKLLELELQGLKEEIERVKKMIAISAASQAYRYIERFPKASEGGAAYPTKLHLIQEMNEVMVQPAMTL